MEQTRVQVIPGTVGRVALVRLRRNTDLVTGLIEACKQAGFKMASVQMMIGSFKKRRDIMDKIQYPDETRI